MSDIDSLSNSGVLVVYNGFSYSLSVLFSEPQNSGGALAPFWVTLIGKYTPLCPKPHNDLIIRQTWQ